ncbi:MAG: protein translocase subunit SecF [Spirochaetaceae bacterium]|jgi:preprotein translocase subunit SecF|nr:protein translocase subunit SecF [Spirochaetaceae bacterium]
MKRIIPFSKFFLPAAIFSLLIVIAGVAVYIAKGGFNLGIDFKAGLIQEVQLAPTAFSVTYSGNNNATVSFTRLGMELVISGSGTDGASYSFNFADYPTLENLTTALSDAVDGINIEVAAPYSVKTAWFLQNAHGNPQINTQPYVVHYLEPDAPPVELSDVRDSLETFGDPSVQILGAPADRHFLIRIDEREDPDLNGSDAGVSSDAIVSALEATFGTGEVVVNRSDFVGSRFSKQLADQAVVLIFLTLLLILIYASIRFKPQFAVGAVIAILHDALIMVAFITWTRMEFNTATIAAILTILGYSINDTIVVFDRIRESRRLYPEDSFKKSLNRAITETLSRTIITTVTTMLAVVSLYIFTSGSMKDFALALLVGMISGVYSTIFIACGFSVFWENYIKKEKQGGVKKDHETTAVKAAEA